MIVRRIRNVKLMASHVGMVSALIIAALSAGVSTAQQPQQAGRLQFEVAAIKPGKPGQFNFRSYRIGHTFHLENMPLRQWVEMALSVSDYALKAPSWLDGVRYDLDAEFPAGGPFTQKDISEMMRRLLVDRFALKWHEEQGTASGYELVMGRKLLLKPSDLLDPKQRGGRSRGQTLIAGHNMPMSDLAAALGEVLEKPVVDATHVSGGFEIKLGWRPDDEQLASAMAKQMDMNVDDLPLSVFTALQEQAGLRLQSAKVPSRVVVVDNINRQPTEN